MRVEHGNVRDITEKVLAKFESGKLVFYYNRESIGWMGLELKEIIWNDGYLMEDHLILATVHKTELNDHYAENCGEGWC